MSPEDVHKHFQTRLKVSRVMPDHGGRIIHTLAEVHPERLRSVYEEWIDNGPRSVTTQQGLLFLGSEADS